MYQRLRAKGEGPSSDREGTFALPLLFVLFTPSSDWTLPLALVRAIFLLILPIEMFISSGNTLTDTPSNNVLPAIWTSLHPVRLTHKINCHTPQLLASPSEHRAVILVLPGYAGLQRVPLCWRPPSPRSGPPYVHLPHPHLSVSSKRQRSSTIWLSPHCHAGPSNLGIEAGRECSVSRCQTHSLEPTHGL